MPGTLWVAGPGIRPCFRPRLWAHAARQPVDGRRRLSTDVSPTPWANDPAVPGQIRPAAWTGRAGRHTALVTTVGRAAEAPAPPATPASGTRLVIGSAGVAAGVAAVLVAAVLVAVALPWVTLQHGRQTVNGVQGDGSYLAAGALGAGALGAANVRRGRPRPLRALAALTGAILLAAPLAVSPPRVRVR